LSINFWFGKVLRGPTPGEIEAVVAGGEVENKIRCQALKFDKSFTS
jgi:hypothetical protein